MNDRRPPRLLLVTGMSGAGKSHVLDALEDMGWDTVDNLPVDLLESFFLVLDLVFKYPLQSLGCFLLRERGEVFVQICLENFKLIFIINT